MDLLDTLVEGFDYDLWANLLWLESAKAMPDPARPIEVLEHIAWAQETWLQRCEPNFVPRSQVLGGRFTENAEVWKKLLGTKSLDETIHYTNTRGDAYGRQLWTIARHTVDHGTYHRGQIRGLCEAQSFGAFPETGYMYFLILNQLHGS